MANTPRRREENITGQGKDVHKWGEGIGSGPVGTGTGRRDSDQESGSSGSSGSDRPSGGSGSSGSSGYGRPSGGSGNGAPNRAGGGGMLPIIIIIALVLLGGGGGLSGLLGGFDLSSLFGGGTNNPPVTQTTAAPTQPGGTGTNNASLQAILNSIGQSSTSTGWASANNTGSLNTSVALGARNKYVTVKGRGADTFTIMVFMCGTDLESSYGMATNDLREMAAATISGKVNIIVYTGGCKKWKTNGISNTKNMILKVESGRIGVLEADMGSGSMVSPDTLSSFIKYCGDNGYIGDRNMLIFWDHGGGSLSGYGYDEKNPSKGSMSLAGIKQALDSATSSGAARGLKFDIIGFDACLMATAETGLMLDSYADYMIASEETEPGIGWYYTNWLTKLSSNTSMSSLEIGKNICDDFVSTCASECRGQSATLSVVDLAELAYTLPGALKAFADSTAALITGNAYQTVSAARSGSREFAVSSKIDQVDLTDLCNRLGTADARNLANAILGAVKYNKVSTDMTNAYGLSIYFPYKQKSYVNTAVKTYSAIGMDSSYSKCIQQFATLQTAGQASTGGASSALSSLIPGYESGGTAATSSDMVSSILSGLLSGNSNNVSGYSDISSILGSFGSLLGSGRTVSYIYDHMFSADRLVWAKNADNINQILLTEDDWSLIQSIDLNVFIDDGEGYIDLGLDNNFTLSDEGALLGDWNGTWLAVNRQPVAYYHEGTTDDGKDYSIRGYIPVLIFREVAAPEADGLAVDSAVERDTETMTVAFLANLLLTFDNKNPYGVLSGIRTDYRPISEKGLQSILSALSASQDPVIRRVAGNNVSVLIGDAQEDAAVEVIAKAGNTLLKDDVVVYLCDYYSYAGEYLESYAMGEPLVYNGTFEISDVFVDASKAKASYVFTDLYDQKYWTPVLPK
ncbi:MAG: peptidase C11 [Lachnospiraceae bacterium]|nr:peptidase C11 [Lachnospiraceae bacterium]